ncbi:hypothetical protein HRI_004033100 [Hibiscus trionum]|uniref:TF-B3 domain-containing protein n=1 Tax=Hibiscus trionum TaxID=183268 RepID=A0A9W7MIX8_HIBTR|nr:hypothetical protein HRI_004033100 [Hibiscus trionum]
MFSKLLTRTDIDKRLAIPARIMPSLPGFDGSHAVRIRLLYGTRMWPFVCTVRRKGYYKKPVFSGRLWRDFVIRNNLDVGHRITVYKVVDEDNSSSHYRVELEKTAGWRAYGSGTGHVGGEVCQPYTGVVRLDLSLAPPDMDGSIYR